MRVSEVRGGEKKCSKAPVPDRSDSVFPGTEAKERLVHTKYPKGGEVARDAVSGTLVYPPRHTRMTTEKRKRPKPVSQGRVPHSKEGIDPWERIAWHQIHGN